MIKKTIRIKGMKEAERFNQICTSFDFDMDLIKGKYYIDAKSIMGIFSLSFDTPVQFVAGTEDETIIEEAFKEFIM